MRRFRGQTSMEYLLLLGAAVLAVVTALMLVKGQVFGAVTPVIENNASSIQNITGSIVNSTLG